MIDHPNRKGFAETLFKRQTQEAPIRRCAIRRCNQVHFQLDFNIYIRVLQTTFTIILIYYNRHFTGSNWKKLTVQRCPQGSQGRRIPRYWRVGYIEVCELLIKMTIKILVFILISQVKFLINDEILISERDMMTHSGRILTLRFTIFPTTYLTQIMSCLKNYT